MTTRGIDERVVRLLTVAIDSSIGIEVVDISVPIESIGGDRHTWIGKSLRDVRETT